MRRIYGRWESDSCGSLGSGAERSTNLEVIVDVTGLGAGVEGHVGASTVSTLGLDVDVGDIVNGKSLTFGTVELTSCFIESMFEALTVLVFSLSGGNVMEVLKEGVVLLVASELKRVLVVGEESVVSVGKISEGTALLQQKS
jgi:hypothetical protein